MKYPQLSAMPSGVQDWLDEQLEARGIDPVVYTRYVLSLLRRDSLPEKGPSKRVRREDCESVRRAAAVECLMSASDQQFGMEKLVDELCVKLQEIKSLTESSECDWQRPPQRATCEWPPLAGAPLAGAPRPMGAGLEEAPPTAWGHVDDQDGRSAWPRRLYQRQPEEGDDPSLARLMAKFDQSIEALWSPEPELPADEPPAVDFPPVSPPGSKSHVFIPSGTNITSSIWSDCADDEAVLAHAADLDGTWTGELDNPVALARNLEGVWSGELDDSGSLARSVERVWSGELDDSGSLAKNLEGVWSGELDDPGTLAKNLEGVWSGELDDPATLARNLEAVWSGELDDPGSLARNLEGVWSGEFVDPGALARNLEAVWSGEMDCSGNLEGVWSGEADNPGICAGEVERSGAWAEPEGPGGWPEPEDPGSWAPSWAAALLNHSKQESSFTEVVPKTHEDLSPLEAARPPEPRSADAVEPPEPVDGELELEEDLLTSTRTHFKPIRSEAADGAAGAGAGYADGTTFVIAASLEVLAFRRCQSGTLLLESEAPPAKYREYKEKEPYAGRYIRDDGDELSEFVPKFRVSVNEKCCQTEPGPPPAAAADETETETDFFFPGDAVAWEGAVELEPPPPPPRDHGGHGAWNDVDCSCRPDSLAPWQQAGAWAQAGLAAIWQAPCGRCEDATRAAAPPTTTGGGQGAARRLREELSRDGDQLLSDLSYIFLGSDWLHDSATAETLDDDDDDDGGAPSAEKLQCLSPAECADAGLAAAAAERETLRQHARSVDAFLSTCLLSALPSALLVGAELAPWPRHTERKRRHSVCQRSMPEPPGYVRRPPCVLVSHGLLRPVTL